MCRAQGLLGQPQLKQGLLEVRKQPHCHDDSLLDYGRSGWLIDSVRAVENGCLTDSQLKVKLPLCLMELPELRLYLSQPGSVRINQKESGLCHCLIEVGHLLKLQGGFYGNWM